MPPARYLLDSLVCCRRRSNVWVPSHQRHESGARVIEVKAMGYAAARAAILVMASIAWAGSGRRPSPQVAAMVTGAP